MRRQIGWIVVVGAALSGPANAVDLWGEEENLYGGGDYFYASPDKALELRGSIGVIGLEAREHVFPTAGATDNLSLLIWQSVAPMATGDVRVRLPDDWTVSGRLRAAISGTSYMQDYDWTGAHFVSYDFDDWTHRSQHPDTNLDWYFDGSLAVGRDVMVEDAVRVNLNGGFKYTDVQWTATGGSYIYSVGGFRDTSGNLADTPAITYRQQLPTLFAGLDIEAVENGWTYGVSAKGGMTLFGVATDHHWMRVPPLRFIDNLQPAPMLSLAASAGYDLSDNLGLFFEGTVEKVFLGRADTEIYNNDTDALIATAPDAAGAELASVGLSAGLKGSF